MQLAQLRRDEIKPSLKAEYSTICSAEVPIGSHYLFGDDLAKQLLKKQAKSAIPLQPHLRTGRIEGDSTTHTKMTATLKAPGEIVCGKANSSLTKRKNHRTTTRNNVTAASNKIHGKWVNKFSAHVLDYLQNLSATFKAGQVAANFAAWRTLMTNYYCLIFWGSKY